MQRDKKRGSARKKKIRPRPPSAGTQAPPVAPKGFPTDEVSRRFLDVTLRLAELELEILSSYQARHSETLPEQQRFWSHVCTGVHDRGCGISDEHVLVHDADACDRLHGK